MRNIRLLAVGVGSLLGAVGLLNGSALAQAPADPNNPPVSNCNLTPDTNQG